MRLLRTLLAGALSLALLSGPALAAGTIFGLPLSQQFNSNGELLVGAKLYLYEADTTTPVSVYEDFGLSSETSNPLVTDADGRVPEFWLADGSYRARLTTSSGVVVFDIRNTTAIGASSGGGGSGSTVSQNSIFTTGMFTWLPVNSTKTGWVRANGRTIGSASSAATERANADTQPLYEWLWNNCSNTNCPVSSGRGSSASADFSANKTIGTLDLRGRGIIGLDTMGNDAASVVAAATTAGNSGGAESSTALIAHTHGAGSYAVGAHTHQAGSYAFSDSFTTSSDAHTHSVSPAGSLIRNVSGFSVQGGTNSSTIYNQTGSLDSDTHTHTGSVSGSVTGTSGSTTPSFSGTSGSAGSGSSFSIMDPYKAGTWYIRL